MYTFVYWGPATFGRHETRPAGVRVQKVQRVLRFDGPLARGLWYRPSGDEYVWLLRSLGERLLNDKGRLL